MPRPLGWVLVAGGVGYVLSAFVTYLAPGVPAVASALTIPASVGEFWMMGYLLVRGVRRSAVEGAPRDTRSLATDASRLMSTVD